MTEPTAEADTTPLTLVERKQRAARSRIIDAADELFAERGFDAVSVTDIAERAEVGRTTFFRHFGDKTEVVFAKEQAMFDAITTVASALWDPAPPVQTLGDALSALEPLVLQLCAQAISDLATYRRHTMLLDAHEELRAREAVKHQYIANEFTKALIMQNAPVDVATIAGQLAVACYYSGRILASDPADLVEGTADAFRKTLAMQSAASN
ncbi:MULTISPECIES: TetR/AcrR family transcriptional regulator [unclassified Curtobacterium]|uniref:TetR/AcrR family transcriptional regulator n=1 Tax=unclassified Curtobacterium TaxID=257496 RepID=UPI000DA8802C|nr:MULTISPECIES: TetR/AcrR family transcriptional regulator [unclassified Curtobacterium]PZE37870.1 TetR/AcrR family transcriptional regulator [Curtobacterium sp. MCPF17_031]PZF09475.1 TetR/AcrR family transcriptional regulator [Curtobacterium sp. MCPF17_011]